MLGQGPDLEVTRGTPPTPSPLSPDSVLFLSWYSRSSRSLSLFFNAGRPGDGNPSTRSVLCMCGGNQRVALASPGTRLSARGSVSVLLLLQKPSSEGPSAWGRLGACTPRAFRRSQLPSLRILPGRPNPRRPRGRWGGGVINYSALGLMPPNPSGGWRGCPVDFICTQWK